MYGNLLIWGAFMVQRGSVCLHPSRSERARGLMGGMPIVHRSATAAALPRINQKIK
jgi:hypothetical protein